MRSKDEFKTGCLGSLLASMSKHQSPLALRLSWIPKAPDNRHDEDLGFANDSPSVPSLWGVPLKYIS